MWHDFGRDRPVSSLTALEEIPEWDGAGFAPSAALTASPNVFLAVGRMRRSGFVLADEDVSAPGPVVETGAGVPGYSGGFAACVVVSSSELGLRACGRGQAAREGHVGGCG